MVAYNLAQRLTPTLALVLAGALGMIAALAALLLPGAWFESAVITSGIAAFIPAAEPPLGATARICLGVFAGGGVALLSWGALSLLTHFAPKVPAIRSGPSVRRADAHPDAPPREPLYAGRDLGYEPEELDDLAAFVPLDMIADDLRPEPVIAMGAPTPQPAAPAMLEAKPPRIETPPVVQALPADLDQPLSAFDPAALLDEPRAAPRPVAPLCRTPAPPVYADGERFETFDLAPPPAAPMLAPISAPETVATVHSLLDRLERGIARRTQPAKPQPLAPAPGLESTLETLRRMAVRA